jgi:GT2 family glycosyltransferase
MAREIDMSLADTIGAATTGAADDALQGVVSWFHAGECTKGLLDHLAPTEEQRGCGVAVCTLQRPVSLLRFLESLADQTPRPKQVVIVDASPDDSTERALRDSRLSKTVGGCVLYLRVAHELRGQSRQRNMALRWTTTDLVAFFDDDVVLLPNCLQKMESVHRSWNDEVVGAGARIVNEAGRPGLMWRLRRLLCIVPSLQPGKYFASGVSTPWSFLPSNTPVAEGDWLPGGAAMWRTPTARRLGFSESFQGYANGEDLEFSIRAGAFGRLLMVNEAELLHLRDPAGRPSLVDYAYISLVHQQRIHEAVWGTRSQGARLWFAYAATADALLQSLNLLRPSRARSTWLHLRGTVRFFHDCFLKGRSAPSSAPGGRPQESQLAP